MLDVHVNNIQHAWEPTNQCTSCLRPYMSSKQHLSHQANKDCETSTPGCRNAIAMLRVLFDRSEASAEMHGTKSNKHNRNKFSVHVQAMPGRTCCKANSNTIMLRGNVLTTSFHICSGLPDATSSGYHGSAG